MIPQGPAEPGAAAPARRTKRSMYRHEFNPAGRPCRDGAKLVPPAAFAHGGRYCDPSFDRKAHFHTVDRLDDSGPEEDGAGALRACALFSSPERARMGLSVRARLAQGRPPRAPRPQGPPPAPDPGP